MFPARPLSAIALAGALFLWTGGAVADPVDDIVQGYMQAAHIPGAAVAVIDDGRLVKLEGYGQANLEWDTPVTPDTPFQTASASKVVAGVVLIRLVEQGTLSLGFSWYLQTFVRTASYGPLAAMMGFLIWTWLTVQIVILGAELNAEVEHQTALDTTTGAPAPLGERGAVMADSVGAQRGHPAALAFTLKHAEALSDRLLRRRIRRM